MTDSIRVNFARPIPLFPLRGTVLLPHALLPLHVFEARYVQMVGRALDHAGQIAIATVADPQQASIGDEPALRRVACVGQIVQHVSIPGGRYDIVLHGVCRAAIANVHEPDDDRKYRTAELRPLECLDEPKDPMVPVREEMRRIFTDSELRRFRGVDTILEWIDCDDVPTHALLEFISASLIHDPELKYRLLAEPDVQRRASIILREFTHIDGLIRSASRQGHEQWPRGMSWN